MDKPIINKSKGIPVAIALTVIAGIVLVVLGLPSLRGLRYQSQAAGQAKYDYESGKKFIANIQTTYTSLSSSGLDKQLSVAAPADEDIPSALVQLDAMVSKAGLSLNSLSPSTENGKTDINIIVSGGFTNLQQFMKLIETNLRPFNVQSVSINSFEADGKILTAGTYEIILSKNSIGSSTGQSINSGEPTTVTSQ